MLNLYIDTLPQAIVIEANNFTDTLAEHRVKSVYFKNEGSISKELYSKNLTKEMLDLAEHLTAVSVLTIDAMKAETTINFSRIEVNKHVNILTVDVINTNIKFEMIINPHNKLISIELSENMKRVLFKLFKAMRKFEIISQQ